MGFLKYSDAYPSLRTLFGALEELLVGAAITVSNVHLRCGDIMVHVWDSSGTVVGAGL